VFRAPLFLTATPHNGHSNSFSALLEMLDPQRFTRGVEGLLTVLMRLVFILYAEDRDLLPSPVKYEHAARSLCIGEIELNIACP
jgi:hypothetical protein